MEKFTLFFLIILLTAFLTACRGVTIDGDTVRIAEENCSIKFISLSEVPYEEIAGFTDNGEIFYPSGSGSGGIYYTLDDRFKYYKVEFTHQGKHDISSLVLQPGNAETNWAMGFAPNTEFIYFTDNSTNMKGLARVIAGNTGNSSAYL